MRFTENRSANQLSGAPRRWLRRGRRGLAVLFAVVALPAIGANAERDLFNEAERRFRGGNYAFALEAYEDFLERYPLSELSADAAYRAGVAQTQLGRYREAVETFEQVQIRHRSTRYLPFVNFWAGVALYELEQYDRASASLTAFVNETPDAGIVPRALLYLGLANVSLNDLSGAAEALEQLRAVPEDSESTAFGVVLLGYVYALQGRYVQMLLLAEDRPPETIDDRWRAEYLAYRAEAYWQLEQYPEAEGDYAAIVDAETVADSIASVALRRLFIAAERRGDFDLMDSVTLRAELRFRESPEQLANFWLRLGIENYRRGSLDLARFFLKRSAELGAESEVGNAAVLYLAETYLSGSDPDGIREATRVLTSQQELSTGNPWQVSLRLGDVMLRQGDFAGAIAQYESFIRAMAEDPDANEAEIEQARYLLAYALYREGRYDEALRQVRQIDSDLASGGPLGELRRLETVLLSRTGDTAAAERSARSYVDRFPDDISARVDHLRLLYRLESWQELLVAAAALTDRVPDLRVRSPRAFVLTAYLKGLAHVARGEPGAAATALDAVTADLAERQGLGDIVPYALYYRAASHYRQGSYGTASVLLAELEDQFRGHELESRAAFLAGQSAFSIGSYRESAAAFTRAANSNHPRAARAGLFAGRSLANSGDLEGAERQYRNVVARFARSPEAADATFELAGVLALGGQRDAATRAYGDVMFQFLYQPAGGRRGVSPRRAAAGAGCRRRGPRCLRRLPQQVSRRPFPGRCAVLGRRSSQPGRRTVARDSAVGTADQRVRGQHVPSQRAPAGCRRVCGAVQLPAGGGLSQRVGRPVRHRAGGQARRGAARGDAPHRVRRGCGGGVADGGDRRRRGGHP